MPPEPTFSRSHLSAFRNSLKAPSMAAAAAAAPSCCHKQLQLHATATATRVPNETDFPWTTHASCSTSASCTPSPTTAEAPSSAPSSPPPPPPSRPPSTDVPGKVSRRELHNYNNKRKCQLICRELGLRRRWDDLASDDIPALRERHAPAIPRAR